VKEVNEGSTAYLTVVCKNKAGAAQAPASAVYRIDDLSSGEVIKADTSLPASTSMEITLSSVDNRIVNSEQGSETRRVVVSASYGADDAVVGVYLYKVKNVGGVTSE